MKLRTILSVAAASLTLALVADEPLVKNVAVHQRWPWSPKVDVDYLYTGTSATTLVFTATWRGQETPVNLVSLNDTGTFSVTPGQHRFTWDPVAAGYGDATLQDFRVTVEPGKDPRTYLVLDLKDGGYELLADVPEGGWTDTYKSSKMAFRRIPAGTYQLGTAEADLLAVTGEITDYYKSADHSRASSSDPRTVTLTSDFYFAVFLTTGDQYNLMKGSSTGGYQTPQYFLPSSVGGADIIRGATLDDGTTAVDWPSTGYKVKSSSLVGGARALSARKGQPPLRVDLATDAQWEIAMRAGTTTFFPNGGTKENTSEELKALYSKLAQAKYDTGKDTWTFNVGLKDPNPWGIYDFAVRSELVLDYANYGGYWGTGSQHRLDGLTGGVDPVGPQTATSSHKYRVRRSGEANFTPWGQTSITRAFTALRTTVQIHLGGQFNTCFRMAIHLKPLVNVE